MILPLFIRLQMISVSLYFPDVDECQNSSSNICEQLCVNFPASFFCDCRDGYELNADGRSCDGKTFPG